LELCRRFCHLGSLRHREEKGLPDDPAPAGFGQIVTPMTAPLRILLTGFGPFPGAPFNPTIALVKRLLRLRRPALDDVALTGHIFHVTYQTVDRELPELLARHRPDALLMFGLAGRTSYLRIETRARNAVTMLWPDADHARARKGAIARDADAMMLGPHTARLLRVARLTGIDARASRDAGSYLCNYLSWRAIEATRAKDGPALAAFVHVPPVPRDGTACRKGPSDRITPEQLVDAGEAVLMEMVKLTRRRLLKN
jgi:pyroglutamyl-peptidase